MNLVIEQRRIANGETALFLDGKKLTPYMAYALFGDCPNLKRKGAIIYNPGALTGIPGSQQRREKRPRDFQSVRPLTIKCRKRR